MNLVLYIPEESQKAILVSEEAKQHFKRGPIVFADLQTASRYFTQQSKYLPADLRVGELYRQEQQHKWKVWPVLGSFLPEGTSWGHLYELEPPFTSSRSSDGFNTLFAFVPERSQDAIVVGDDADRYFKRGVVGFADFEAAAEYFDKQSKFLPTSLGIVDQYEHGLMFWAVMNDGGVWGHLYEINMSTDLVAA